MQEASYELNLEHKHIQKQLIVIFKEIEENNLIESDDILDDLTPLIGQLGESDNNKVRYSINKYFKGYEFVKHFKIEFIDDQLQEQIDYIQMYIQDRKNNNYESILQNLKEQKYRNNNQIPEEFQLNCQLLFKLERQSLLVFDLLDYQLDKKELTQFEVLKTLLDLFYSSLIFNDTESIAFDQLVGSLLLNQVFEISYYIDKLKQNDSTNFKNFVFWIQQQQLRIVNDSNNDFQMFQQANEEYKNLLTIFNEDILNIRQSLQLFISELVQVPAEKCSFLQILSHINNIENINDELNHLKQHIVLFYLKQYCTKFNFQFDLKSKEDYLLSSTNNERRLKYIERYFNRQKSNTQETIYLFVIHRIFYFVENIDDILGKENYQNFVKKMDLNFTKYQNIKQANPLKIIQDKERFFEYWNIIHKLQFCRQQSLQQNNLNLHLITCLLWITKQHDNFYNILNIILSNKAKSLVQATQLIQQNISSIDTCINRFYDTAFKTNLLKIIYTQFPHEEGNYQLLQNLLLNYGSYIRASMIIKVNNIINKPLDHDSLIFFAENRNKLIVIQKVFQPSPLPLLASKLLDYISSKAKDNIDKCLLILKSIFQIKQIQLTDQLQFIKILTNNFSINLLSYLIRANKKILISQTSIKLTLYAIFNLTQKINKTELGIIEIQRNFLFKRINFPFFFLCIRKQIPLQQINQYQILSYNYLVLDQIICQQLSQKLYQQDEQLYEEWFKLTKPYLFQLSIEYQKIQKVQQYYPKQMDFPLENFNISLSIYTEDEQKQILSNWIEDMSNVKKFKLIIPLLFNIIKRGEPSKQLLLLINQILQSNKGTADQVGYFNLKTLFQIFYNNSTDELRIVLMKFFLKEYPIPFLYQNPQLKDCQSKSDLFLLNTNLFYYFEKGYTIINLSLSLKQKQIGKTELINEIFYHQEKFSIRDTCKMNQDTIDIMFDFEFNNSRNYIIADVHGRIITEILIKILPFFKLWIIQMDSEEELQENLEQINIIKQQIGQNINNKICLIIRNTNNKKIDEQLLNKYEIKEKKIQIFQLQDFTSKDIDQQFRQNQIEKVSQFLFKCILDHQKHLNQKENLRDEFLTILEQFQKQYSVKILEMKDHYNLISLFQKKLNEIVNLQDGFCSQKAFGIRRINLEILRLKNLNNELHIQLSENQKEIEMNIEKIKGFQQQIQQQQPTDLLNHFCDVFKKNNYYIVYLWILDVIRNFNENNLVSLQKKEQELVQLQTGLKQEKKQLKRKHNSMLSKIIEDPKYQEIIDNMLQIKQQLKNNDQNITHKNICIELFWRELISLQKFQKQLKFNLLEILFQLIRKGEPLEFLDGDTQQIDFEFLIEISKKFTQNKQDKTLVLSMLGPQSSGKSTLINKIFGCHLWANVGRTTKGVFLQILQVQNKQKYQNHFDQILILDTEGLQNPNQVDEQFDKKMALFMLSVSDITLITVKGEINQQFKRLIEVCIFTLGHLKQGSSMVKQLSWIFNQNDKCKDIEPFRQQIKDIASNLNLQWDENHNDGLEEDIDYEEILDTKGNICVLGFVSRQKDWSIDNWNQTVNNHTFSKEAHQQGLIIIEQFISKLKDSKASLQTFDSFLQNVKRNWDSIEKLPDISEFSEVIEHQQNNIMRQHFDQFYRMVDIQQVSQNLFQATKEKLLKNINLVDDKQKTLQEIYREIEQEFFQKKNQILQKLNSLQEEMNIKKKILVKYQKKLEELINNEEITCKQKINEIFDHYKEKQLIKKRRGNIEQFIQDILEDTSKKQKFQGNTKLIQDGVEKIWESFRNESKQLSQQQQQKSADVYFFNIQSISNQYKLNTKNEIEYINYFHKYILQENPYNILSQEFDQIFEVFKKELYETDQFLILEQYKQNLAYQEIFYQSIRDRIEKSKDQLINMKEFFYQEITYNIVTKQDIQLYLNNKNCLAHDFFEYFNKNNQCNNLKTKFNNYFVLLDYFQIFYDQQCKKTLEDIIIQGNKKIYSGNARSSNWSISKFANEAFLKFQRNLKFNENNNNIDLSDKATLSQFKEIYQNLKVKEVINKSWQDIQTFKSNLQQNSIIINTKIDIYEYKSSNQESFKYILNPQGDIPDHFRKNFPKQFNTIMIEKEGWKKLYQELYLLIKKEISLKKHINDQNNYNEDQNYQQYNPNLIIQIMQKIKNNIKVKYNNYFALFGIRLTDVGERCIYYYSMLIIWRFICYSCSYLKNKNYQLKNNYQNELCRCFAEINQDSRQQSQIKARQLVTKLQAQLKSNFLIRNKKQFLEDINNKSISNAELIEQIDNELLINANDNMMKDREFQQKLFSYTTDQKSYINKYINEMLSQFKDHLIQKYSNEYQKELQQYFVDIKENAQTFFQSLHNQNEEVSTIVYFIKDENLQNQIIYENYLFDLVFSCLHGKFMSNSKIQDKYKILFNSSKYKSVKNNIPLSFQQQQKKQVHNLKTFIQTLIQSIDLLLINISKSNITQNDYQFNEEFIKLRFKMNGCEYACPFCNRKCDQDNDDNHKHQCQNGHQLLSINGFLYQKRLFLYACEEIPDQWQIHTQEAKLNRTWKEAKKIHSTWLFKSQNGENRLKNKRKWANIWNKGLGKLICSYLEKKLKVIIKYSQITAIFKIHYILILNDTSKIKGEKWETVKNGALECIKLMEKIHDARVSIIIFNDNARIAVECEQPNTNAINKKIHFSGGNTDFGPPFQFALNLIDKHQNFTKIQILFYSDGEASYPKSIIDQFIKLPDQIRSNINLIGCSAEKTSNSLALIVNNFKENMASGELRNSIEPKDIQIIWKEVVMREIHQTQCMRLNQTLSAFRNL
ncbi:unnamed protein product [Paramecium octaurelia]|uniref:VLIG-type G domain-containing protein n=1 Tax=Paramecium octaurelia TaxID=43137 RepID=A0A8S1V4B0_PAROT|nr:unnamed protein product [Paramecium octaurelia]